MKFTINLQPTIAIERSPSKSFTAAQLAMLALPLVAFIIIGFFYWHALARQEDVTQKVADVETEKTKLQRQRKKGLKAADRKSIVEQRDTLRSIFKERVPVTALLLAKLEEKLPGDCYASWMAIERRNDSRTFKLNMRGKAPSPSSIADMSESLQELHKANVSVNTMSRKRQNWEFELAAMLTVEIPKSEEPTLLTTSEVLTSTTTSAAPSISTTVTAPTTGEGGGE